jgi:hypothetical protein
VLRFSPETLEFGEIALGEKKTLSVSVENPGKRPVAVLRTLFSCACLGGGMERSTLDPGETGTLNVTFTGVPGRRSYSTTVSIITDEPGACRYEVGIRGQVELEFTLDPEALAFGTLELNEERTLETVVRRRDGRSFEIREIPSPRPEFSFAWKPVEEGKGTAYRITAKGRGLRAASLVESATVVTDRGAQHSPQILLSLEAQGNIRCAPSVAVLRVASDGTLPSVETVLKHKEGKPLKVESVRESRELPVRFELGTESGGGERVRIHLEKGIPSGAPFGEFLITVAEEPEPIRLPYRIELSPSRSPSRP